MIRRPVRALAALLLSLVSVSAIAQTRPDAPLPALCPDSPEAAAIAYLSGAVPAGADASDLFRPGPLKNFGSRVLQVADPRYAPGSAEVARRWFGAEAGGPMEPLDAARAFIRAETRVDPEVSDIRAERGQAVTFVGVFVSGSYQRAGERSRRHETLSAGIIDRCWQLDVPESLWRRINDIAAELSAGRPPPASRRVGPSTKTFSIQGASDVEAPGTQPVETVLQGAMPHRMWVYPTPLLTEVDLAGASADWVCASPTPGGRGMLSAFSGREGVGLRLAFRPEAAERLNDWILARRGAWLQIDVDGRPLRALWRAVGLINDEMTLCLERTSLEEARALAAALSGEKR